MYNYILCVNDSKDFNATKGYFTVSRRYEKTFYFVAKGQDYVDAFAKKEEVAFIEAGDFSEETVNFEKRNMSTGKYAYSMDEVEGITEAALYAVAKGDKVFLSNALKKLDTITYLVLQMASEHNGPVGSLKTFILNTITKIKNC